MATFGKASRRLGPLRRWKRDTGRAVRRDGESRRRQSGRLELARLGRLGTGLLVGVPVDMGSWLRFVRDNLLFLMRVKRGYWAYV